MLKPHKPFTVPHFQQWSEHLLVEANANQLDDQPIAWERFQLAFVKDLFAGSPEAWLVVPEGNGKTTLLAALALYHCEFRPFASVHVAAASRDQAEIDYRQAEGFVLRSPHLHEMVHSAVQAAKGKQKTQVPRFHCLEGYRRINHANGSRIQIFAADDRTGDGVIPTLAIVDEPHRQRDLSLYRTWSGKLYKRGGQIVAISTAGDPQSDFELTRAKIHAKASQVTRRGSFARVVSGRVVMHEWAVPEDKDPTNLRTVKAANPLRSITLAMLREKFESPTMTMSHWLRFVCNRPTEDIESWLGPNARAVWGALADPWTFRPGAETWVGLDMALKRDTAAVVALQKRKDGHWHARCRIWTPTSERDIDTTDVMQYIRDLAADYDVREVSYDPRFFDVPAKYLEDEGLPMIEVPQSLERMTRAVGGTYEDIRRGAIRHDGDELFAHQVVAAVPRYNERGFTLAKSKSRGHIDAAIALSLAHDRAQRHEDATTTRSYSDEEFEALFHYS